MSPSPEPRHSLPQAFARLDAVESAVQRVVTSQTVQYTELKVDMARVDAEMRGMREQARAHSEQQSKAMADLKLQLDETHKSTRTLVCDAARELQEAIDKIIGALGVDEDPNAAYTLRYDLKFLKGLRKSREELFAVILKGCILMALGALGVLLLLGTASYFHVTPMVLP